MGKAEQRAKDSAMAAGLQTSPVHSPRATKAHKERNFRSFMAQFDPKHTGSAKYQRRRGNR